MIAYKLFRIRKDNTIGSLFINKKEKLPINKWLEAKSYPTKGFTLRPYWHCTLNPIAPHLTMKDRKWFKVEINNYIEMKRPLQQGGSWLLCKKIKILNETL
jgi:hypothetical protein